MRLLAPAKINLHLRVGRRRDDGFHPLLTWMCTVGLFDTLTLEAIGRPGSKSPDAASPPATGRAGEPVGADVLHLRFDCDRPGLPLDEGNLVVRIAKAFAAEVFAPPSPTRGGGPSLAAHGATGSRAQGEGRGGAGRGGAGPAGAARVEASGMGEAGRSAVEGLVTGTDRGAGAARDAGWPVGAAGAEASPPTGGHSRTAGRTAPAASVGIRLSKRVPVGAGLGGGSSDAARTLVGLDRLWEAGRAADELSAFAARFGSDVPFFVAAAFGSPSAACSGRGEVVRTVPRPAPKWALLVLPPFPLATRDVYARFDEMGLGSDRAVEQGPDWGAWSAMPAAELLPRLVNDLEPPAFELSPRLAQVRAEAEQRCGRPVRMSGSGSSLFTLFDAGEEAEARGAEDKLDGVAGCEARLAELAPQLDDDLTPIRSRG